MPFNRHRHDVVIVGARAAGAAIGLLLARLGHDVVVVDRAVFPADTMSTHQLARTGVLALHRWGLLPDVLATGTPAIRQVTFTASGESVTRPVKHKAGVDLLVAPRRYIVDTLLADAAAAAGADVRLGVNIDGLRLDISGRVAGVHGHDHTGAPVVLDARFVVGADGLRSKVARSVGARVVERRGQDGAAQYAYFSDLPWNGIELVVADRALAGVFPTHDGQACVWVCTPTPEAQAARRLSPTHTDAFTTLLRRAAPDLAARLRDGRRTSPVTGMLRMPNLVRRAYGPGWALAGDAAVHRDAVTGHGMSDAYRDAELLATALHAALSGEQNERLAMAGYQTAHDRAFRDVFELTCALAAYPPVPEFIELQKQLGRAIDAQSAELAARPLPGERELARV